MTQSALDQELARFLLSMKDTLDVANEMESVLGGLKNSLSKGNIGVTEDCLTTQERLAYSAQA